MTSFRGKPWTNLERWTLFTFYKRDSKEDWYGIPLLFRRFFHVTFLLDIVEQFRYTTSPPNGREVASGTTRISCRWRREAVLWRGCFVFRYARCADEMEATRKERIECRPKGYYTPAVSFSRRPSILVRCFWALHWLLCRCIILLFDCSSYMPF